MYIEPIAVMYLCPMIPPPEKLCGGSVCDIDILPVKKCAMLDQEGARMIDLDGDKMCDLLT